MAVPQLSILVDWRRVGLNLVANDDFEADTSGWSTAAGIASAATSITRVTPGMVGNAAAEVVTTSTNGSGVKYDFGTTTFTSGRTYRFRLYARSMSGTTSAKIIIGSLGAGADRSTTTMTLTTTYTAYSVDWTPGGNRTDVEAVFSNNAASIMTARIDHVEVWETINDITPYADYATWTRGANFDGTKEVPGQFTVRLKNDDGRFSPDNSSGPLFGLLKLGRTVYVRAFYNLIDYGQFYGTIRRITPRPRDKIVEIVCEDPLYRYSRSEVSVPLSLSRSIRDFRFLVMVDMGEPTAAFFGNNGIEDEIVYTEADQVNGLDLLTELNTATGSVHFILPQWSTSRPYYYRVVDRIAIQGQAVDQTWNDNLTDLANYEYSDESLVNTQRVFPTARRVADVDEVVWEADVPFTISTDTTVWAGAGGRFGRKEGSSEQAITFTDPTFDQVLTEVDDTGATVTFTPFSRSAMIEIAVASPTVVSTLFITGKPARRLADQSVQVQDLSSNPDVYSGSDITSDFIASLPQAEGIGAWWVYRYKDGVFRPDVTFVNNFDALAVLNVADRVSLTFPLLGVSSKQFLIRSITTSVDMGALEWTVTYGLESTPTALSLVTLDAGASKGLDSAAVLGY